MSTYALFIASSPDPVSDDDWTSLEQLYDRARLSSGGTTAQIRSAANGGHEPQDFDTEVATFVNGIHLEIRDDGLQAFAFVGDGGVLGTATLADDGQWHLVAEPGVPVAGPREVAYVPDAGHTRREVEVALGKFVHDWLQ